MASSAGTLTVPITVEMTGTLGIVVAAVKMHDALFYGPTDVLASLPSEVHLAYADLQSAIAKAQR